MYNESNVQLYDDNHFGKRSSDPASGPRPVAPVGQGRLPVVFRSSLNIKHNELPKKAVGGTHGLFL